MLPPDCSSMEIVDLLNWHIKKLPWSQFVGLFAPVTWMIGRPDVERAKALFGQLLMVGITEQLDRSLQLLAHEIAPYGFELSGEVPRRNTTDKVKTDGIDLREHQGFLRCGARLMPAEEEFYEWAVERFERRAAEVGL